MILRFIGANGSMGLKHGKTYSVSIKSQGEYIIVTWTTDNSIYRCPYSSPKSFAANWESPGSI